MRTGLTSIEVCTILLLLFVLLATVLGFDSPVMVCATLVTGWVSYTARTISEMTVDPRSIIAALLALILFAFGVHKFCGWLYEFIPKETGRRQPWRGRWTFRIVGGAILIVSGCIAATGIGKQIIWHFRGDGNVWGIYSRNNLKQIGIAVHNHHDDVDAFPSGVSFDSAGKPLHSWVTLLLPFFDAWVSEDFMVSREITMDAPWDDPVNEKPFQQPLRIMQNSGILYNTNRSEEPVEFDRRNRALAHYAGNRHLFGGNRAWRVREITDGTPQTLMAGEVNAEFRPWGDPQNSRDPARGINQSPAGFGSPAPEGAHLLFVGGHVKFISKDVDPAILRAMATPDAGEFVKPVREYSGWEASP